MFVWYQVPTEYWWLSGWNIMSSDWKIDDLDFTCVLLKILKNLKLLKKQGEKFSPWTIKIVYRERTASFILQGHMFWLNVTAKKIIMIGETSPGSVV